MDPEPLEFESAVETVENVDALPDIVTAFNAADPLPDSFAVSWVPADANWESALVEGARITGALIAAAPVGGALPEGALACAGATFF